MTPYEYKRIDLSLLDIPAKRLRGKRPERIETLAKDIAVNGQLQPILVVELENGRFSLDDGALRVAALQLNKTFEIDARVTSVAWLTPEQRRVREIMINLNREDFTALERCEALTELKAAYEVLYPSTKNGARGGRGGKEQKNEIFSFSTVAADTTGLSRRSIEIAVAIFHGLTIPARIRLQGTWIERKQSELRALSEADPALQDKALNLLLCNPPEAGSVADAIILAQGRKLTDPTEKAYRAVIDKWKRFQIGQKRTFISTHRDEIVRLLTEEGTI